MAYLFTDRTRASRPAGSHVAVRQSWRDWALFAVAYGVIVGAILFAGQPEGQRHAERAAPIATSQVR